MFPDSTLVNKRIPKKTFYENANFSPAVKKAFTEQVKSIIWMNKISAETISVAADKSITEIEVFMLEINRDDIDNAVLTSIDKSIPYNIIFMIKYDDKMQCCAIYKGNNINKTISTGWKKTGEIEIKLKGIDLDTVWENIIIQIGDVQIEQGKTLDEQLAIDEQRAKLQKEIARLEKLARSEKQPKKKFDIVKQIQKLKEDN